MPWLDIGYKPIITALKQQYPEIQLALQAHRAIMEQYAPQTVAHELARLPVDYILFDPSQSRAEPYDAVVMRQFVAAARRIAPNVGVVVAGGLGADGSMARQYAPIVKEFGTVSCDAFGKLQDRTGQHLDWQKVMPYMQTWQQAQKAKDTSVHAQHRSNDIYTQLTSPIYT